MKINSLDLKHWGKFKDDKHIDFSPGLNIIVGPNESGKSTIRGALIRIFFSRHNVPSSAQEYIPWGTAGLNPEIGIEFEDSGKRFKASKRFIKNLDSNVEILENGDWTSLAEGDDADNHLVSILEGTLPSRGPKLENMGIVRALWTPQGSLSEIDDLGEAARGRLLAEVGGVITTDSEGRIMKILESQLDERLTRKTREPSKKSELQKVDTEIVDLKQKLLIVTGKATDRENRAKELETAENSLNDAMLTMDEAEKELEQAETAAESANEHKTTREAVSIEVKELDGQFQVLHERALKFSELIEIERKLIKEDTIETPKISAISEKIQNLNEELNNVNEEINNNEDEINKIENQNTDYRIAYDTLRRKNELTDLSTTLTRIETLEEKTRGLQKELETTIEISDKDIKSIIKKDEEINKLQAKLDAQGLDVQVSSRKQIKGSIKLDEEKESFSIKKGNEKKWKASQVVHITMPDLLEIKVASGSKDVKELSSELVNLKKELHADLAKFGVNDLDGLRSMSERRKLVENQLKQSEEEIENRATGGLEELRKNITELTAKIASDSHRIKESSAHEILNKKPISQAINDCAKIIENYEDAMKKAKDNKRKNKKKENDLNDNIAGLNEELRKLKDRKIGIDTTLEFTRKDLVKIRQDGLSDEERIARTDKAAALLEISLSKLRGLDAEVREKEERPLKRLDRARNAIDELKNNIAKLERTAGELRGSIGQLVSEGDYSELAEIEARLSELKDKKHKLETEARALALLFDLIEYHRTKAIADVVGPVSKIIDENLQRLVGPRYKGIELDEKLMPCGMKIDGLEENPDMKCFSHGTREQMGMLLRLAVAEVIAKGERLPILLEEPLAHTDASRRRVAVEILQEYAERLQIIIFTCHPEHYVGLSEANHIDL